MNLTNLGRKIDKIQREVEDLQEYFEKLVAEQDVRQPAPTQPVEQPKAVDQSALYERIAQYVKTNGKMEIKKAISQFDISIADQVSVADYFYKNFEKHGLFRLTAYARALDNVYEPKIEVNKVWQE